MYLTDIYLENIFCPDIKDYIFFSVPHVTFSKTDYVLRHKVSLHRNKTTERTPSILFDHHRSKLEINRNNKAYKKAHKLMET